MQLAVDLPSRLAVGHRETSSVITLATGDRLHSRDVGLHSPVSDPRSLRAVALNDVGIASLEDLILDLVRHLLVAGWCRDPASNLSALLLVLEKTANQRNHTRGNRDNVQHVRAFVAALGRRRGGFGFSFSADEADRLNGSSNDKDSKALS